MWCNLPLTLLYWYVEFSNSSRLLSINIISSYYSLRTLEMYVLKMILLFRTANVIKVPGKWSLGTYIKETSEFFSSFLWESFYFMAYYFPVHFPKISQRLSITFFNMLSFYLYLRQSQQQKKVFPMLHSHLLESLTFPQLAKPNFMFFFLAGVALVYQVGPILSSLSWLSDTIPSCSAKCPWFNAS